ncbi:hypothetical protein BH23VER1_BH23VER1_22000 [soil metagenome]
MTNPLTKPLQAAAAAGLVFFASLGCAQDDFTASVSDDDKAKIAEAVPTEAPAEPKKDRKILVFTKTGGFRHGSIPHGVYGMQQMGEKSGAYSMEHSEDPEVFRADNLERFDAIMMLNTTGEPFEDDERKAAFEGFVKEGKGLIGIHAASDTFYQWPEYGQMIGGYFDGHPWGSGDTVTMHLDDPDHVCNAPFDAKGFAIKDEIYQYRPEPYSREKLRILYSLDHEKTDMSKGGMKREDGDYAVGWVQKYGDGRVFYSNLGHNNETYWNPEVMAHFLAGIQFAVGDLEGDTTPSGPLPKP